MTEGTHGERIRALEIQMNVLTSSSEEAKRRHESMDAKLDSLLELRNKGMGAFWLVTTIVGAGFIGMVTTIIEWLKNALH